MAINIMNTSLGLVPKKNIIYLHVLSFLFILFLTYPAWFGLGPTSFISYLDLEIISYILPVSTVILIFLLVSYFFGSNNNILVISALLIFFIINMNNILIQPVFFYFIFSFLVLSQNFMWGLKYITMSVYIVSGFQKINPYFLNETVPHLFSFINNQHILFGITAILVLFEIIVPFLFFIFKRKNIFLYLFIVLNLGISFLAFFDKNINISVLIWVLCLCVTGIYFYNKEVNIFEKGKKALMYLLIILFSLLPLLGYLGLYPSYLSFKIYSGNTNLAKISSDNTQDVLINRFHYLDLWFFSKYSVYPPPQTYIYREIMNKICSEEVVSKDFKITVLLREKWISSYNSKFDISCERF